MNLLWVYEKKSYAISKEKVEEWPTNAFPELLKVLGVKVYGLDGEHVDFEVKAKVQEEKKEEG